MKKISGISERIKHFDRDVTEQMTEKLPTFRKMFMDILGGSPSESGEEAIAMYKLGMKMMDSKEDDLSIEDSEFSLLSDKCKKNGLRWMAHYHAQVLIRLQESEKGA